MDIVQLGGALVRVVGKAAQAHHLAAVPLESSLGRRAAHLERLGDVHTAGHVAAAPLQGGKLDGACLAAQLPHGFVRQKARRARQRFVPERIHRAKLFRQLAYITAVVYAHALRHRDDHACLGALQDVQPLDEMFDVKGHLRQADHIHAFAVLRFGQCRRTRQPARITPHHLNNHDVARAVYQAVAGDLLHNSADVLGRGAVARRVVGVHQVVVDGLGHAHELDVAACHAGIVRKLGDGVHAVIATNIEKVAHIQLFQNTKQLFIQSRVLCRDGQLVPARAQV